MTVALTAWAGFLLDRALGEPRRWHPLVGFGGLAAWAEQHLRRGAPGHPWGNRLRGLLAWGLVVLPWVALAVWLRHPLTDALLLWLALGGRSLEEHARAVAVPLEQGALDAARQAVGRIVSRETATLEAQEIATATVETVLENGNDAVFATLFWFFVAGGPGVLLHRLANTLDAMWGYKDARRRYFGWAAARLDDGLNYLPARLTALTYAALGRTALALACWRTQAGQWSSPSWSLESFPGGKGVLPRPGRIPPCAGTGRCCRSNRHSARAGFGGARTMVVAVADVGTPAGDGAAVAPGWALPCLSTAAACVPPACAGAFP